MCTRPIVYMDISSPSHTTALSTLIESCTAQHSLLELDKPIRAHQFLPSKPSTPKSSLVHSGGSTKLVRGVLAIVG